MTIWFLARATGMVALMAFTAATAMGALATRAPAAPTDAQLDRRFLVQMAHRSAAVLGLVGLLAHATLIVVDAYVDVSLTSTLLPFTAGYRPLWLGLGTLSVYAFVLAAVSGAMRGRLAASPRATRAWRRVHLSAYAGWAAAMCHGILSGTDTGAPWSTAIYVVCGLAVAVAVALRLGGRAGEQRRPFPAARTSVRSPS